MLSYSNWELLSHRTETRDTNKRTRPGLLWQFYLLCVFETNKKKEAITDLLLTKDKLYFRHESIYFRQVNTFPHKSLFTIKIQLGSIEVHTSKTFQRNHIRGFSRHVNLKVLKSQEDSVVWQRMLISNLSQSSIKADVGPWVLNVKPHRFDVQAGT